MATKKPAKPRRADWEAIKRDYRTGKYSQRELCALHGINEATLSRRIKKDQAADSTSWQNDLRGVVRDATNARLMQEAVKSEVKQGQEAVKSAILVAAEVNTQVILGHRDDIKATRNLAMDLMGELSTATKSADQLDEMFEKFAAELSGPALIAAQQQFRDFMKLHARVGSVQKLADTLTKLQTLERKAFNLDAEPEKPPGLEELSDEELDAKIEDGLRRIKRQG